MKTISIHGYSATLSHSYSISLANGLTCGFPNKKEIARFLVATSKFFTSIEVELNSILSECYTRYRDMWLVAYQEGTSNKFGLQHRIKQMIESAEFVLERIFTISTGPNNKEFTHSNLIKASNFLREAGSLLQSFHKKRSETVYVHQCGVIVSRCMDLHNRLMVYGKEFATSDLNSVHLKNIAP